MAKYMIHAVPKRMWYVKEYLLPSLENQGISCYDVSVYCDDKNEGNLRAFTNSLRQVQEDTWHLQDDVLIGSYFAKVTSVTKSGVICGFCSSYSKDAPSGTVTPKDMWYSFPCIRIPLDIGKEFLEWLEGEALQNSTYKAWIEANKFDDSLFMEFMKHKRPQEKILNLNPNLVEHVDYLIGGSLLNKIRDYKKAQSIYFNEPGLVEELREELKNGQFRYE